ncbi:TMV resistance protein N-like [Quercus lobata]|uniref:TMV resistance protein N-like n=1 Tax=Quercus lobata TaxID=97700 RepID=UPI00124631D5|nr:TMV resistance protein N-like [Quercus lobata]
MLKSLNSFDLVRCSRLEKFPNSHPEMKCLRDLDLQGSGIRELPSSKLCLRDCPNLRDLPDTIYKLQQLQDLSIPTTRLRFTCNSFDSISGYGFLMMEHLDIGHCLNLNKLDFLIQPDYFPALKSTSLPRTNIITIPESISRFPRLGVLSIQNCKQLREILGLPKSIKWVNATDCFKLDLQSLLSQVEAIMGILPNTSCEGAGTNLLINTQLSDDFASKTESEDEGITCFIIAPGAEIPEWCNHRSVGNYISFWVGRKFPKIALCIALGQNEPHQHVAVYFYINGRGKYVYLRRTFEENSSYLWLVPSCRSFLQNHLDVSYPSEQNHVEFVYEIKPKRYHRRHCPFYKPRPQNPTVIKRWGVHVECICCPHKSGISYFPFQSAKSSSVHDNSRPLPLLALFPSSSASDMDRRNFNNEGDLGISIETTNIAFDTAWRRDFDPDEFKLTLPPKAIFSSQLQYDDPCWCQKTKYESLGCILVNAGGFSFFADGAELPLLLHRSPTWF